MIAISVNTRVLSIHVRKKEPVEPRERMIRAAAELLTSGGRDAVSTRAVCAAADVQTPTIYRHFGDMRGLLDAAATRRLEHYLQAKRTRPRDQDPVNDLRRGWDHHVEFGLTNPGVYALLYGDPRPDDRPAAMREGDAILRCLVERIAQAGRLRVDVDRAVQMIHAACRGVGLTLISTPVAERDQGLSTAIREAILSAITSDASGREHGEDDLIRRRAVALKAVLGESPALTRAETGLLTDWLDRLSGKSSRP
jgi:AcrR family transcriptional regulator